MEMVGQQAEGKQAHVESGDSLVQDHQKGVVFSRVFKEDEAAVAAIHRMINRVAGRGSEWSYHGSEWGRDECWSAEMET